MSPEERARAFDRLACRHERRRLGIGLAIVQKLAEADAATVALEARTGGGLDAVVRLRRA